MSKDGSLEKSMSIFLSVSPVVHFHFKLSIWTHCFPVKPLPSLSLSTPIFVDSLYHRVPFDSSSCLPLLAIEFLNCAYSPCECPWFFLFSLLFSQPLFRCSLLSLNLATNQEITGMVFSEILSVLLEDTLLVPNIQWYSLVARWNLNSSPWQLAVFGFCQCLCMPLWCPLYLKYFWSDLSPVPFGAPLSDGFLPEAYSA